VVVQPLLDTAFNGAPPRWERFDLDIDGAESVYPLDPHDIGSGFIILTNSSFHIVQKGRYSLNEIESFDGIDTLFEPHYKNGIWVISDIKDSSPGAYTFDTNGYLRSVHSLEVPNGSLSFIGCQVGDDNGEDIIIAFWANDTHLLGRTTYLSDLRIENDFWLAHPMSGLNYSGPFSLVQGWTFHDTNYFLSSDRYHYYRHQAVLSMGSYEFSNTSWGISQGDNTYFFTRNEHWENYVETNELPLTTPHFSFTDKKTLIEWNGNPKPTTTFYSEREDGSYQMDIIDRNDYYLIENDDERSVETVVDDGIGLFRESPNGKIWIIEEDQAWRGEFSFEERGQMSIQIISFLIAGALVAALLIKPKWWLVDIGGLLMGAGVIALMGISFPLPFTLLLLVLLAVYDFISVYKTKHMIALADSVVEAKMPILLVFPMKWSYRYEDETNLMDPKRKRESLFMGLGDVIIPGILILSAASFLSPMGGIRLFGFIYPPVAVALFALAGMLAGWLSLMYFVIKGKAHAGLPPINSGTIIGFLLGMLVVYGTIVFW
jgi:presenilin-like A22 family membrane protease